MTNQMFLFFEFSIFMQREIKKENPLSYEHFLWATVTSNVIRGNLKRCPSACSGNIVYYLYINKILIPYVKLVGERFLVVSIL